MQTAYLLFILWKSVIPAGKTTWLVIYLFMHTDWKSVALARQILCLELTLWVASQWHVYWTYDISRSLCLWGRRLDEYRSHNLEMEWLHSLWNISLWAHETTMFSFWKQSFCLLHSNTVIDYSLQKLMSLWLLTLDVLFSTSWWEVSVIMIISFWQWFLRCR